MKYKIMATLCIALLALMAFMPQLSIAPTPVQGGSLSAFAVAQQFGAGRLAQAPSGLRVEGNTLSTATGERFIIAGANVEMYRDYKPPGNPDNCNWASDGLYAVRDQFVAQLKTWGVNIIRLNYDQTWLQDATYLSKFLDVAESFAKQGVYVMISDHAYTGGSLTNSGGAFPVIKAIVDGMRARLVSDYLVVNPFNEPGPNVSDAALTAAYRNVLTFLRNTADFQGVVVLDGSSWAKWLNVPAFKALQDFDATQRGATPNIMLSIHLYPGEAAGLTDRVWTESANIPILFGEIGQENGAAPVPKFVRDLLPQIVAAIPNGFNGAFAWIVNWCDTNKLLEDWRANPSMAYTGNDPLSPHGVIWKQGYFDKLRSGTPAPTAIVQLPTVTPTRSVVATNTPRRSRTPPPTFTPTGTLIAPTATPTPTCDAVIEENIKWNGRDALATTCVRLR